MSFYTARVKTSNAQNEQVFSGLSLIADIQPQRFQMSLVLPPPALRERWHRGLARRPARGRGRVALGRSAAPRRRREPGRVPDASWVVAAGECELMGRILAGELGGG